jgi:signal peptide peptidase SppA
MFSVSDLIGRLYENPLLLPAQNAKVLEMAAGSPEEIERAFGLTGEVSKWNPFRPNILDNGIAVVPVMGTLMRGMFFDDYADLQEAFDAVMNDPSVRGVVMDIDSPGGDADGAFDLADHIFQARGEKPIYALANSQATSAAYALGSSADKFFGTRNAIVGSIGVYAMHVDRSKANEKQGLSVTEISAGKHKLDLSRNKPLSATGKQTLQRLVDMTMTQFVDTVSRNRGLSEEAIRSQEAAVFLGPDEGKAQGLLEGPGTLAGLVDELATGSSSVSVPAAVAASTPVEKEVGMADPKDKGEGKPEAAGNEPKKDNVVDIDAVRQEAKSQAATEEKARRKAVRQVCELAGLSAEQTLEHLESNISADDLSTKVLEDRAKEDERVKTHGNHDAKPQDDAGKSRVSTQDIYAARRKAMNGGKE